MLSVSRTEIKLIHSLSSKKFRDREGLFVVEGEKMVDEALHSPKVEVVKVFRRADIGEDLMARISLLDTPSPALAIVRKPVYSEPASLEDLSLALDSVRDPGNMGTILRIADWFGVNTIYASADSVDCFNPKAVQASMGSIFRVDVRYCQLDEVCRKSRESGNEVCGTFLDGDSIYTLDLPRNALLIMGSEAFGISEGIASLVSRRLYIPKYSSGRGAESLNVAAATAVTLAEFRRQQNQQ